MAALLGGRCGSVTAMISREMPRPRPRSSGLAATATELTRRLCSRSYSVAQTGNPRHVVVAGGGFAGASTAMHLTKFGAKVTIVDPRPALTATSQYSSECYRNFFMDEALVPFMTRSVDIMEDLAGEENSFQLTRRGYCFLAGSADGCKALQRFAAAASGYGGGEVREHRETLDRYVRSPSTGFRHDQMHGFDLVYGSNLIQELFPFVSSEATTMLHARRCGWLDGQGLGQAMLTEAKQGSTSVLRGSVLGFDRSGNNVTKVHVLSEDGRELAVECDAFVNAAGAWMPSVHELLDASSPLPLKNELHAKVILNDTLGVIPQDVAPFMVWQDSVSLEWDEDSREGLLEMDDTAEGGHLNCATWLQPQPGGQHLKPSGNGRVVLLWSHLHKHVPIPAQPSMPVDPDLFLEMFPQLCVAGLKPMIPGFADYDGKLGRDTVMDGGYYTVTPDGRPLVGPAGAGNAFVCGGMGTYGLMGAPAAGELAARHVLGLELPEYADACCWPRKLEPSAPPVELL